MERLAIDSNAFIAYRAGNVKVRALFEHGHWGHEPLMSDPNECESKIDEEMRLLLHQGLESAEKLRYILHRLNRINEYRTIRYLDDPTAETPSNGHRIIEL